MEPQDSTIEDAAGPVTRAAEARADGAGPRPLGRLGGDAVEDALWDVAAILIAVETPDQAVAALGETLVGLVPVDTLEIMELDPASAALVTIVSAGEAASPESHSLDGSLPGTVAVTGEPMWDNDVEVAAAGGTPVREAVVAVPLDGGHGSMGTLYVARRGPDSGFDEREFEVLCHFGRLAALVLNKARRTRSLQIAAETDALTGLPNLRSFSAALADAMGLARAEETPLSILMFDVDDFKRVNDTYGHEVGDDVLRGIATIVRDACRAGDVPCRTGGEEFSIVLPRANLAAAHRVGERLLALLQARPFGDVGTVTVSAGAAEWDRSSDAAALMRVADRRQYAAKAAGKARVVSAAHGGPHGDGR